MYTEERAASDRCMTHEINSIHCQIAMVCRLHSPSPETRFYLGCSSRLNYDRPSGFMFLSSLHPQSMPIAHPSCSSKRIRDNIRVLFVFAYAACKAPTIVPPTCSPTPLAVLKMGRYPQPTTTAFRAHSNGSGFKGIHCLVAELLAKKRCV